MNDMKPNTMDFDPTNSLKRCNSTQVININNHNILPTANKPTAPSPNSNTNITGTNAVSSTTTNPTITSSRSRDASPTPAFNIFAPRARRYSTGFSPLATNPGPLPRLTPRVSQLRQEECLDMNSREVNHEREVHSALQISQSWEDLTLDAESWSFKSDNSTDLTNPLHVTLPAGISCSSPSPTSSRTTGVRLPPYGLSPSPTRRTFQTRRSMSPIAMRPSSLGPVKRKFELDENYSNSYSPPPFKKIFSDTSRGHSPCRSPLLQSCPSPDSTEGRTTPKFYISELCTANTNSSSSQSSSLSAAPSPNSSSAMEIPIDIPNLCAKAIATVTSANSDRDLNSDIECSDVDLDNDEKLLAQKLDEVAACEKLKKLFFARVSTETECSIDFKTQLSNESNLHLVVQEPIIDNKSTESSMDCDSIAKTKPNDHFSSIVQNLITSTNDDDINMAKETAIDKSVEIFSKCVPTDDTNCIITVTNNVDTINTVPIAASADNSV